MRLGTHSPAKLSRAARNPQVTQLFPEPHSHSHPDPRRTQTRSAPEVRAAAPPQRPRSTRAHKKAAPQMRCGFVASSSLNGVAARSGRTRAV